MTRQQFIENETQLKEKVAKATYRYERALANYDTYEGRDYAEEKRLSIIWRDSELKKIEAEKKLLNLQAEFANMQCV